MSTEKPLALVAGYGFLGERVGKRLAARGFSVVGLVQNRPVEDHSTDSIKILQADITVPSEMRELARQLPRPEVVVFCASSRGGGVDGYRAIYLGGSRHLLDCFDPQFYLQTGSSSVYSQKMGEWVDEESRVEPETATGRVLRETELEVLRRGGCVARCSGLYGPGRSVYIRKLRDGTALIPEQGDRFVNQIHIDDAASALCHLIALRRGGEVFNVTDGSPMTLEEVYRTAATRLGSPMPPHGEEVAPRKRGDSNKRLSHRKLLESGWTPRYPSYNDWLQSPDFEGGTA